MTGENYQARIEALGEYARLLREYLNGRTVLRAAVPMSRSQRSNDEARQKVQAARSGMNRLTPRVGKYLRDVDYAPVIRTYPPRAVGGPVLNVDLIENIFIDSGPHSIDPDPIFDFIERAIGAYEELLESGETLASRTVDSGFGLLALLESKLRLMFSEPPTREKEVQDGVETLFKIHDIEYEREAHSFAYSSKNYIPDFVLRAGDVALEIKFCGREGREKELIAEVNDDIVAYGTAFDHIIFCVYDMGQIRDVARFKGDLEASAKSIVMVVKH